MGQEVGEGAEHRRLGAGADQPGAEQVSPGVGAQAVDGVVAVEAAQGAGGAELVGQAQLLDEAQHAGVVAAEDAGAEFDAEAVVVHGPHAAARRRLAFPYADPQAGPAQPPGGGEPGDPGPDDNGGGGGSRGGGEGVLVGLHGGQPVPRFGRVASRWCQ